MYIFGASTLGEIVLDVARDLGLTVSGFVDDVRQEKEFLGLPIVGGLAWLFARAKESPGTRAFVAIGGNSGREKVFRALGRAGVSLPDLVHPRAYAAPTAELGGGNLLMANAYVGTGGRLGVSNLLLPGACLTHHNRVGDFNFLAPGVAIGGRTTLGNGCKLGMNTVVASDVTVADGFACPPLQQVG